MDKLPSNYRRRTGRPAGGHVNTPAAVAAPRMASAEQIGFLNDLLVRCGQEPVSAARADRLTMAEARDMITEWKDQVPPPDPDKCPKAWDEDIWRLALLFEEYARADRISLRVNRTIVYQEIEELVVRFEMRGRDTIGSYHQEVDGCKHRTDHPGLASRCWYHWPPKDPGQQVARDLTWAEMIEVVMAEFWSRQWDDDAADHFRQHFREYGQAAVKHWRMLGILAETRANPAPRRGSMRRATMADATKEG